MKFTTPFQYTNMLIQGSPNLLRNTLICELALTGRGRPSTLLRSCIMLNNGKHTLKSFYYYAWKGWNDIQVHVYSCR